MHTPRHFRADSPEREGRLVRENPFGLIICDVPTADAAPGGAAGSAPDAALGGAPDAASGGAPDAASGGAPDAAPGGAAGSAPDAALGGAPDAASGGAPDAASGGAAGAGAAPVATHVPMLRKPSAGGRAPADDEPLLGGMLVGHLAKVNPQAAALRTAGSALAVFLGPDAYVSPTWYDGDRPNVPTWNYAAVHVSGPLRVVDDRDEALAIIIASIDATEAYAGTGWDPTPSLDYVDKLLAGIVAFELTATDVRSTFKLSQNKPVETQRRVATTLATSTHGRDRELAALMTDVLRLGDDEARHDQAM